MSKEAPLFRTVNDMIALDMCENSSEFFAFSSVGVFEEAHRAQQYIAMGGYCDYLGKYREVLDLADEMGSRFDGLYLQVFSCDPEKYERANLRAEAIGIEVESFRLEKCESSSTRQTITRS